MQPESLEELIAALTQEELHKFHHLIEECLERRTSIREHISKIARSLEQLSLSMQAMTKGIGDIERCGKINADLIDSLYDDIRPLLNSETHNGPSSN